MNDELMSALDELVKTWGVRSSALCCTNNVTNANDDTIAKNKSAGTAVYRCRSELMAVLVLSKRFSDQ